MSSADLATRYREEGAESERERIIKLLEAHSHPEAEASYQIDCDVCERLDGIGLALFDGVGLALALIKGEQK